MVLYPEQLECEVNDILTILKLHKIPYITSPFWSELSEGGRRGIIASYFSENITNIKGSSECKVMVLFSVQQLNYCICMYIYMYVRKYNFRTELKTISFLCVRILKLKAMQNVNIKRKSELFCVYEKYYWIQQYHQPSIDLTLNIE